MDRGQLIYAIMNLKYPKGYRNEVGLEYIKKLSKFTDERLWEIRDELKAKRDNPNRSWGYTGYRNGRK